MKYTEINFGELVGETLVNIQKSYNTVLMISESGQKYELLKNEIAPKDDQDFSPDVIIDEISGDLNDLIGSEILASEEVIEDDELKYYNPCLAAAYYKFQTKKGLVEIRFFRESTHECGERVNLYKID